MRFDKNISLDRMKCNTQNQAPFLIRKTPAARKKKVQSPISLKEIRGKLGLSTGRKMSVEV